MIKKFLAKKLFVIPALFLLVVSIAFATTGVGISKTIELDAGGNYTFPTSISSDVLTNSSPLRTTHAGLINEISNTYVIETMDDFPAPDGGVITLNTGVYQLNTTVTTDYEFVIPNGQSVVIKGSDPYIHGIVYTDTNTLFTGEDIVQLYILSVFISAPAGTAYDITPSSPSAAGVFLEIAPHVDVLDVGDISNIDTFAILNVGMIDCGDGFKVSNTGTFGYHIGQAKEWKNTGGVMLTLDGTFDVISLQAVIFKTGSTEFAIDAKQTLSTGGFLSVGNDFDYVNSAGAFAAGSKDQTDIYFKFSGNRGVQDSDATVEMSLHDNATQTTFTAVDTPAPVLGTFTDDAERFVTDAAGVMKYTGLEPIARQVLSNPTATLVTGTNKTISYYYGIGNLTEHDIVSYSDAGGGETTITGNSHIGDFLSNGDRVYLENNTNYIDTYIINDVTTSTFDIVEAFAGDDAAGDWIWILETSVAEVQIPSATKSGSNSVLTRQAIVTDDFFQLFAENNADGTAIIVKNANTTIQ